MLLMMRQMVMPPDMLIETADDAASPRLRAAERRRACRQVCYEHTSYAQDFALRYAYAATPMMMIAPRVPRRGALDTPMMRRVREVIDAPRRLIFRAAMFTL